MPDRKKAISTLEEIKTQTAEIGLDSAVIAHEFIDKIITLMKEQEAVKPKIDAFGHPYCPKCKILVYETWKFCPHCGKPISWESR